MRESDYNALLVDTTDSIGLVTNAETYELLFLNKAALSAYHISGKEQYQGKCCYQVLRGAEEPCANCPIRRMTVGELYRWEEFSERLGVWYDSTDYLVECGGDRLYVKLARDITARKVGDFSRAEKLTMEDTLFHCLHILSTAKDSEAALRLFLEAVAGYYQADRAYTFEFDLERQLLSNTYEWCGEGITAEIEHLQNVPLEVVDDWVRKFETDGDFSIGVLDAERDPTTDEYRILAAQGIDSLMAAPFLREDGAIVGFLGVDNPRRQRGNLQLLRSATEFIQAEFERRRIVRELEYLSYTDTMTGAYNRNCYTRRLREYIQKTPENLGIVLVNINGMKDINAQYGTPHGDTVIQTVCSVMRENLPGELFRISGDEFISLSAGITRDRFQAAVSELRRGFQKQEHCPVSVGCAWQRSDTQMEDLLEQVSDLMYAEKRNYYDSVLKSGDRHWRTGAAEEVLREIREGRFVVYFQPQIDFATGSIFGAEALVRKQGEDGELIAPNQFIPFYEAADVIRYVDLHVLELACAALREWEDEGLDLQISVNFSRLTLMEPEIVDTIAEVCRKYGISPDKITVEVTENINKMENTHLKRLIGQLKERKFHISLDDFGSSYSNLAILSDIAFDEVKFDRSLIRNIETSVKSQVVVRNSMKMCEELGGSVSVAEGVETKGQMDLLIQYGCYIGQGYYFSKPISRGAFSALLRERNPGCAPLS